MHWFYLCTMELINKLVQQYAELHTSSEDPLLREVSIFTNTQHADPQMLSGHLQGKVLEMISYMLRPRRILEIGTFTGYSALCLAKGLTTDGLLHTIDIREADVQLAKSYFEKSENSHKIISHCGNAISVIETLDEEWDLVFIDADKKNYGLYYDLVFDKVRSGGVIIADNVLWSGKVVQTEKKIDKDTQALLDFNQKIHNDPRVSHLLLPVRDGLMIAWKH